MVPNPWERKLAEGQKAHEIAMSHLKDWLLNLKIADYTNNMEKQHQGIDSHGEFEKTDYDTKARDYKAHKYGDILIEILSVIEYGKPGWYFTSKADFIAYVWWNPLKTDLYDGYLLNIQERRFREFFIENVEKFPLKKATSVAEGGKIWHTLNIAIPIQAFPEGTIFHFINSPGIGWGFHGSNRLNGYLKT